MFEGAKVEISVAEFFELAQGKATADALLSLIRDKKERYSGITREEVELLCKMYLGGERGKLDG